MIDDIHQGSNNFSTRKISSPLLLPVVQFTSQIMR